MGWITLFALIVALFLFIQSLFSLYLKTYAWEYPERLFASQAPASYLSSRLSFSVLIPARYQGAVMYEAIKRVCSANYPAHLLEIIVICASDDSGTIAEAQRAMRDLCSARIRVVTFSTLPITKPQALHVGFQQSVNQVIAIFDAGDDINPDLFNMVNTVMMKESAGIVQAGVQITNFKGHWFGIHHCLDYYFWFKSRFQFHAKMGVILLGESMVFLRRELVARVGGWDEQSISEGANLGLRLSVSRERVRVVYDARYVTRKEAPASLNALMQQRTRWQQGFLQLLWKGSFYLLPLLPLLALNAGIILDLAAEKLIMFVQGFAGGNKAAGLVIQSALVILCIAGITGGYFYSNLGFQNNQFVLWNSSQADAQFQAISWVEEHIPHDSYMVIDMSMWPDLYEHGYQYAHYYWKVADDPSTREIFGNSWKGIDYIITTRQMLNDAESSNLQIIKDAVAHSTVVAQFDTGNWPVVIREIDKST